MRPKPAESEPPDGPPRRRYEPPAVVWEESIDGAPGLAMACARRILMDPQCQAGGLLS